MATCPEGHTSATTDYCDQCGRPILPPVPSPAPPPGPAAPGSADELAVSSATQVRKLAPRGEPCPLCQTPRQGADRYCEVDGYDFDDDAPIEFAWRVTVRADRARFDALAPDDLVFPSAPPVLTRTLDTDSVSVGRRSPTRGIEPDIDLGGTYDDPGVSRRHLRFDLQADGRYAVVDCGSANGTCVNDDRARIPTDTPVALQHGDRVHVGAWTTMTIERQTGGEPTG
jgi:FHA domain